MKINFQAKNIELTEDLREYAEKRITDLWKLMAKIEEEGEEVTVLFNLHRTTNHHKEGAIFHADCSIPVKGKRFYASYDGEDIREAIDKVKETLLREISKSKDRDQTLYKRGAASVKKMFKGLSKRNPFTSKY